MRRVFHYLVLIALVGFYLVAKLVDNDVLFYVFASMYPLCEGSFVRYITSSVDRVHKPEKDFPIWFYGMSWSVLSVPCFIIWKNVVGSVGVWMLALYVFAYMISSAGNPFIPICPAAESQERCKDEKE